MLKRPTYSVIKVTKPEERIQALEVLEDTYMNEKHWLRLQRRHFRNPIYIVMILLGL